MASIYQRHNSYLIQLNEFPRRSKLRLGRLSKQQAEAVFTHVRSLVASHIAGIPNDPQVARWLGEVQGDLKNQLADLGLIPRQQTDRVGPLARHYVERKRKTCKVAPTHRYGSRWRRRSSWPA